MKIQVLPIALLVILLITEIVAKGDNKNDMKQGKNKKKVSKRPNKGPIFNDKCMERQGDKKRKRNFCHELAVFNCGTIFKNQLRDVRSGKEIDGKNECDYRTDFLKCVQSNRTKTFCEDRKPKRMKRQIKNIAEKLWSTRSCVVLGKPSHR